MEVRNCAAWHKFVQEGKTNLRTEHLLWFQLSAIVHFHPFWIGFFVVLRLTGSRSPRNDHRDRLWQCITGQTNPQVLAAEMHDNNLGSQCFRRGLLRLIIHVRIAIHFCVFHAQVIWFCHCKGTVSVFGCFGHAIPVLFILQSEGEVLVIPLEVVPKAQVGSQWQPS